VLVGVAIDWNLIDVILVIIFAIIGSALFSTFSLIIASLVKTREHFISIADLHPTLKGEACFSFVI
jgi:ABC-2 type transport system permease protein